MNNRSSALDEAIDKLWVATSESVKNVLAECNFYGMVEIMYLKNPSIETRLNVLAVLNGLFEVVEPNVQQAQKIKLTDLKLCVRYLDLLLKAAKANDEALFKFAQNFLENHVCST